MTEDPAWLAEPYTKATLRCHQPPGSRRLVLAEKAAARVAQRLNAHDEIKARLDNDAFPAHLRCSFIICTLHNALAFLMRGFLLARGDFGPDDYICAVMLRTHSRGHAEGCNTKFAVFPDAQEPSHPLQHDSVELMEIVDQDGNDGAGYLFDENGEFAPLFVRLFPEEAAAQAQPKE